MYDKVQCTNCKCWRSQDQYIGKRGAVVKTCSACREKDARQKSKKDVKAKRNERGREKKYYETWRQKQRENDEEHFLAHNALIAKAWREKNKEHRSKWARNNLNTRLTSIAQQARVKGIPWSNDMTDEVCENMVRAPCFYCSATVTDGLHGIDRMDNAKGYCTQNCVPCCKTCNFIKKSLDARTFIYRCQHISKFNHGEGNLFPDVWPDTQSVSFECYKKRAATKHLTYMLSKESFDELTRRACTYCGKQSNGRHKNGVDRKCDSVGYDLDNVVSCCSECNHMKCKLNSTDYIQQCKKVAKYTTCNNIEVPAMTACLKAITKRKHICST